MLRNWSNCARNAQLFSDDVQHLAFVRVQRAVGERRLNLNFQKHPNQIEAAKTDAAELLQRLTQRELALFALAERLLRRGACFAVQLQAIHEQAGDLDIRLGNASFGFGQVAHHLKSGAEKQRLPRLLVGEEPPAALVAARRIDHMTDNQPQNYTPESRARPDGDDDAEQFSPILHILLNYHAESRPLPFASGKGAGDFS